MKNALHSLPSLVNHPMLYGFLEAKDRINFSNSSNQHNTSENLNVLGRNSVQNITVTKSMTIEDFERVLIQYPNILRVDLSRARLITSDQIRTFHPTFEITALPNLSMQVSWLIQHRDQIAKNVGVTIGCWTVGLICAAATGCTSTPATIIWLTFAIPTTIL